jgi:hypothetical protein
VGHAPSFSCRATATSIATSGAIIIIDVTGDDTNNDAISLSNTRTQSIYQTQFQHN